MKKQLKSIHDSYAIVACDSLEIKSEATYFAEVRDGSVLFENSSTRGLFSNYRRENSCKKQWPLQSM